MGRLVGIYKIEWKERGYFYFGQTKDYKKRLEKHISQFRIGNNSNVIMQRAYNKYGMPDFSFIKECTVEELDKLEQVYLDENCNNKLCCNILTVASSNRGFKMSEEAKKKMSIWQIGRKMSEEARKNMSISAKLKRLSPSHRQKIAIASKVSKKFSKAAFNTQTGIFYESLFEAWNSSKTCCYTDFCKMLKGGRKNKTYFIYA